jgi:hypothetical protein
MVLTLIGLVNVTKDSQSYFAGRRNARKKLVRRVKADRVQPRAAHDNRRVMQAYHDVIGIAGIDCLIDTLVFAGIDGAACVVGVVGVVGVATVNADNEPVFYFCRVTIEKRRCANRPLHDVANVVVARHAMHRQVERPDKFNEAFVSVGGFVLDQVARGRDEVCPPIA